MMKCRQDGEQQEGISQHSKVGIGNLQEPATDYAL